MRDDYNLDRDDLDDRGDYDEYGSDDDIAFEAYREQQYLDELERQHRHFEPWEYEDVW